jgi:hypothetical protein
MNKLRIAILLSFISDVLNTIYIEMYFIPIKTNIENISPLIVNQMGHNFAADPYFISEFAAIFKKTISIVFLSFIIVIYFFTYFL